MSKILVTGGAGFIGSHLVESLSVLEHSTLVYDNLKTGKIENLSGLSHTFIKGDIQNYQLLSKSMNGCEVVFHLAALTSVIESMENIEEYTAVNLNGTLNVLRAARENKVKKVIVASSAAVYGDSPVLPKTEEMRLAPKSPYAITKAAGEYYCNMYQESFGLETVCTRFFNVFGERQDPNSAYAAAIPLFITKCIKNETIAVFGDGTQTRDFIYVKDLVKALVLLMEKGQGIYNIGYGQTIDINSLVNIIRDNLYSTSPICYVPERPGEIKHSYSSINKLNNLGFTPDYSLDLGIKRTIDFFNNQVTNLAVEKG